MSDLNGDGKFLKLFECFGFEEESSEGKQSIGECVLCGKSSHMYINRNDGRWDCKSCGESGNAVTFLGKVAAQAQENTTKKKWRILSKRRGGIDYRAFKSNGMGYWNGEWLIPVYSPTGTVRDIRRWDGKRVMSTPGCKLQLWGMPDLLKAKKGTRVWLCEGEWDAMVLKRLLKLAGRKKEVVVAVPGAGSFKQAWVKAFKGMDVVCLYDHDAPGERGAEKAERMLSGETKNLRFVQWPEALPVGYDTRDYVTESLASGEEPAAIIEDLEATLTKSVHSDRPVDGDEEEDDDGPVIESFKRVLKIFKKWAQVDEYFERALAISLAACFTNGFDGEPIWVYIVAPPGSGKTLILMSLKKSKRTVFRSSLTPASLVSGFNTNPDPSLIPHLNGKTAIFKDGTEILAMHPEARRETYSILRGAFDGQVHRSFGNGVNRDYESKFNLLIGITPAIHADSQSTMGDRFLKYEMVESDANLEAKLLAALGNISKEGKMEEELSETCAAFLRREVDQENMPPVGEYTHPLLTIAQCVAVLRAGVDREVNYDRDLKYRPGHEVATRVTKQLFKLSQALAFVYGKEEVDEDILEIIRAVACNTSNGFHLDICRTLSMNNKEGMTRDEIMGMTRIPYTTLCRRLDDMEQLRILEKIVNDEGGEKLPKARYRIQPWFRKMLKRSGMLK